MGKKIDHFGQLLLIVVIALLVAAGIIEEGYLLVGLFLLLPLGIWQMISAAINSYRSRGIIKKQLGYYWTCCCVSLAIFISAFFFRDYQDNQVAIGIAIAGLVGAVLTAFYYLYIYRKYLLHGKHKEKNGGDGSI
ncbi:MAG TPA: hypothetical protein PKM63_09970 [Panacibacter sp.]|nr:hypothetical protein [Panacibacter sp.]HNP44601.1 hypothetical protein [Panacibacter sp.]